MLCIAPPLCLPSVFVVILNSRPTFVDDSLKQASKEVGTNEIPKLNISNRVMMSHDFLTTKKKERKRRPNNKKKPPLNHFFFVS